MRKSFYDLTADLEQKLKHLKTYHSNNKKIMLLHEDASNRLADFKSSYIKKKSFNTNSPLLLLNGDIFWENKVYNSLDKIRKLWDPGKMDILLCLKKKRDFFGYYGSGEFQMKKSTKKASALYVEKNCSYAFTGLQVVKQEIITKKRKKIFSLREQIFDSLDKKKLFGYLDENPWFHIGTKDDLIRFREKLK